MVQLQTNYTVISYIRDCDFLYKYHPKSIYFIPKLKQITLNFFFSELFDLQNSNNNNLYVKSIFLFYICSFIFPKISFSFNDFFILKKNKEFILKISLQNISQLNIFLDIFFLYIQFDKNFLKFLSKKKGNNFSFKIPFSYFDEFNNFKFLNKNSNIKINLKFSENFFFIDYPRFWISG